jgi:hypothetical protein
LTTGVFAFNAILLMIVDESVTILDRLVSRANAGC